MIERWRAVPGWPGYNVSNTGKVRGSRGWVLSPYYLKRGGYAYVDLRQGGRRKNSRVHILVLEAFVGPRRAGQECRHLDGNPANNCLENLRWGSPRENGADRVRHGSTTTKLIETQVVAIRESMATQVELAEQFGVTQSTISHIRRGDIWVHVAGPRTKKFNRTASKT